MPPIVLKNGGTPLSFLDNFLGCNLRDDTHDPVDFVARSTPCADRAEWCADRRHARDVRLDSYPIGRVQMWHRTDGWRYVTPARLDERGDLGAALEMETARFVCKALGYRDASEWGYTDKIGSRSTGFALACPPDAADARDVRVSRARARGARAPCALLGRAARHGPRRENAARVPAGDASATDPNHRRAGDGHMPESARTERGVLRERRTSLSCRRSTVSRTRARRTAPVRPAHAAAPPMLPPRPCCRPAHAAAPLDYAGMFAA